MIPGKKNGYKKEKPRANSPAAFLCRFYLRCAYSLYDASSESRSLKSDTAL